MTLGDQNVAGFLTALGIGLLVGIERERRKGVGAGRAAAGLRTFVMAALVGAVAHEVGGDTLVAVTVVGVAALAWIAYALSESDDPGLTSEIALVLTLLLGALAMSKPEFAAAAAVISAIVLAAREPLHRFARRVISESELRSGLTLAASALVILPLTPDRPVGPYGALNLHTIWLVVVATMAISSAGHVAVRMLGPGFGIPITGLASGFVSSAATIAAFGHRAARTPSELKPSVAAAVLSTVATVVQMALLLSLTNTAVLAALWPPLASAGTAAVIYAALFATTALRDERMTGAEAAEAAAQGRRDSGEMFDPWTAIGLASLLAAAMVLAALCSNWLGSAGATFAAVIAGLADTHAPAMSVVTLVGAGKLPAAAASIPILAAMTANTLTKCVMAHWAGGRAFSVRVVPGLVLVMLSAWIAFVLGQRAI